MNPGWEAFGRYTVEKILIASLLYPVNYGSTLIQIGFELPPSGDKSTLSRVVNFVSPKVILYIKYIKSVDGTVGLYRGLPTYLCGVCVSSICHVYFTTAIKIPDASNDERDDVRLEQFNRKLLKDMLVKSFGILISQPIYVVAIRKMAQFVGRETKYEGIFHSLRTIFIEEGIFGWFSGVVPKIIGEMVTTLIFSTTVYAINKFYAANDNYELILDTIIDFLVRDVTQPFQLVSIIMTVNSSGLEAGSPPIMENYSGSWLKCWNDMAKRNKIKRRK